MVSECFSKFAHNQLSQAKEGGGVEHLTPFDWKSNLASRWQLQSVHFAETHQSSISCDVHNYLDEFGKLYPEQLPNCPFVHRNEDEYICQKGSSRPVQLRNTAIWLGRNMGQKVGFKSSNFSEMDVVPFSKFESEKASLDWYIPQASTVLHSLIQDIESHLCNPIGSERISDETTCHSYSPKVLTRQPSLTSESLHFSNSRIGKSCSINFVIPGFMKCATSFVFEGAVYY